MNINAARIAELRKLMKDRGIDAYIIPSADYHQSEYVSAHFKAREYMTGFNGSLGTAVITQNDAGLWTDGRYFTQAKNQLEGSEVRLMKLHVEGTPELTDWIISNVPAGGTVGFDGRTVSVQDGREYMEVFGAKGIGVQSSMDLVGEIWTDRPPLSVKPCFYLEEKWTGESTAHKLSRVRAKMEECGADVHII
ncbi:MAG: aminopeptidase P family N-terminal domain-containing protein, partial [Mogibacterium sp.]|nr:aminopeptidase P family N-terminal domain-containing protein [Mogibacterium sp.]